MGIVILGETLSYLRFNCIWPKTGQDLQPGKIYYIKFALLILNTIVVLFGSISHMVVSVKHNSSNIREDLVTTIALIGIDYFIVSFVSNQKKIAKVCLDLSHFGKFEKPPNFDERNRKLMTSSRRFKYFMNLVVVNICVWPFFIVKACKEQNLHREFQEVCGLLITFWMPFDLDDFPIKQIFYIWQCGMTLVTLKGSALVLFAILESMEHLAVRVQHLKYLLTTAIDTEDDSLRQKRFSTCIEYHNDIFDIGGRIDECYKGCLFGHVLFTGLLFGCIAHRIIDDFSLNTLSVFNFWFFALCIVCHSGQKLINESLAVADTAYNSTWYDRSVSFQKNIVIIIMRSQKAIVVHAGPIAYLSHLVVLTILQTAYSYLTLLNATSD